METKQKIELYIVDTAGTGWYEEFDSIDDAKDSVDNIVEEGAIYPPVVDRIALIIDDETTEELYRYDPEDESDNAESNAG